jgi:hypothetical protein
MFGFGKGEKLKKLVDLRNPAPALSIPVHFPNSCPLRNLLYLQ